MKNILLVMMMFVVGACSTTNNTNNDDTNDNTPNQEEMKKAFISQVAGKVTKTGSFYDDGDYEDDCHYTFELYEIINSNTAIYKSEDEQVAASPYYIYIKIEIRNNNKFWMTDYNSTSVEQAKSSTLLESGDLSYPSK